MNWDTVKVLDKNGNKVKVVEKNGKYTFTMPASKVTVEATFVESKTLDNPFADVNEDAYYFDSRPVGRGEWCDQRYYRHDFCSQHHLHPCPDCHLPVAGHGQP